MVETFLGIQIVSLAFAAFMLHNTFTHYKKGNIDKREFLIWALVWTGFSYFALFPKVLDPILARLFVTRAMDLLSIAAFMILAYLGFQNHVGLKSLQNQIEKIVRERAISRAGKKRTT